MTDSIATGGPATTNNLPFYSTSFVGREPEIAQAEEWLAGTNGLLVLSGPGGGGKTRLALHLAEDWLARFPGGAWLVRLSTLNDRALVVGALAETLGLQEGAEQNLSDRLYNCLADRPTLLILDKCEHLLDAVQSLVSTLLEKCPGLRLIVTSQQWSPLGDEKVLVVSSLPQPDPAALPALEKLTGYAAIRLFVDRARLSQPDFELTEQNAPLVAQICRQLDGLPLALELAAVRLKLATLEQVSHSLTSQLGALGAGLSQQQIMQASLDWSYSLLSQFEQLLLLRLSVFRAGCNRAAAEVVCSSYPLETFEIAGLLEQLVNRSLLVREVVEEETRYRLPALIRQYAQDRLVEGSEAEKFRENHRNWFLALATEAVCQLSGNDQLVWLQRLQREHDNLRAALRWSLEKASADPAETENVLRMSGALWRFWRLKGYWSEGLSWLEASLMQSGGWTCSRAWVLCGAGILTGEHHRALARWRLEESLALFRECGDKTGTATALQALGQMALTEGDYAAARRCFEQSLTLFRDLDDWAGVASLLDSLGWLALMQDDYEAAQTIMEENLALCRRNGNLMGSATVLHHLADLCRLLGDYQQSETYLQESLEIFQRLEDRRAQGWTYNALGETGLAEGRWEEATQWFEAGRQIYVEMGDDWGEAGALYGLAEIARYTGNYTSAQQWLTGVLSTRTAHANKPNIALTLHSLARLELARHDFRLAQTYLHKSLLLFRELNSRRGLATALETLGGLLAKTNQSQPAVRFLSLADWLRQVYQTPRPPVDQPFFKVSLETARAGLDATEFETAWQFGQFGLDTEILDEAVALSQPTPNTASD